MSSNPSINPYDVVLADLRAQREKIEVAIQAIEALHGPKTREADVPEQVDGPYTGLVIHDATIMLLRERGRPMGNAEIVGALKAGGLRLNSADPINTVGAVLTRRASSAGDLVKVGRGVWGLQEWKRSSAFQVGEIALVDDASEREALTAILKSHF